MLSENLFSSKWCDQVFEGRNKAYGAYQLRKTQGRNSIIAMLSTFALLAILILVLTAGKPAIDPLKEEIAITDDDRIIEVVLPDKLTPKEKNIAESLRPKGNENTTPQIVDDSKVTKKDSMVVANVITIPGTPKGDTGITNPPIVVSITHKPGGNLPSITNPVIPTVNFASKMPEFKGGEVELVKYMKKQMKYTKNALDNDIEGKVYVEFVVSSTGKVEQAKLIRGLGYGLDDIAVQGIKDMPDWIPGNQNGNPVNVKMTYPITFKLSSK